MRDVRSNGSFSNGSEKRASLRMQDAQFLFRMLSVPVVAGLLTALWVSAASASEVCTSRQLANGRPGETVVTCENVRAPRVARKGTTRVWHARSGRLVAAR